MTSISVVIISYNYEPYIGEAIQSVLTQTHPIHEIIVVDNCSADGTVAYVQSNFPQVRLIVNERNLGVASGSNVGIRAATGNLIAMLDADDYWHPQKIAKQMEVLEKNASLEAVFSLVKQFKSPELTPEAQARCVIPEEIMVCHSKISLLAKRQAFDRIGLFQEGLETNDFIEWFSRATRMGIAHETINEVLAFRRVKPGSLSQTSDQNKQALLQILRNHLNARKNEQQ